MSLQQIYEQKERLSGICAYIVQITYLLLYGLFGLEIYSSHTLL